MREYCLAGAAESMPAPVDIIQLNQTVQQIIQLSKDSREVMRGEPSQTQPVCFSGLTLHPHENRLTGADGSTVKLTTSENRVLIHFVSNPWALCTRDALAEVLYGSHRPTSDQAEVEAARRKRERIPVSKVGASCLIHGFLSRITYNRRDAPEDHRRRRRCERTGRRLVFERAQRRRHHRN